jgi:RHS repeat-associated protein
LDKITNIDGTTESFDWDNLFRLKSATDVNGVNTLLDYHYGTGTSLNFVKHSINYPNLGGTQQTIVNVSYVDGLYRNKQLKQFDQSPEQSGESILTEWSYDNFGRVFESFEPLSSLTSENSYTASSQTELTATSFEPSPLNRVSSSTPPDWHATQSTYGSNDAGEVINQTTGQPYAPNTLFKTSTIDPIGQVIEVFADKRGNQVLNRVKESNTSTSNAEIADTYTLYDLKDRPIITLPPQTDMSDTDLIFKKFYSGDDLVLTKDDPDCDPVDFVYDDRDLLRYRQDGERRAENKWYAIEYDDYGQIIKEGFAPTTTAAIDDILITNTWSESGIETGKMLSCTKALLEVDSDLEITETYEYDQVGRLKTTRYNSVLHPQAASIVETLTYDDQNNILEATQDLTLDDITIMYSYDYDNVGRPERTSIEVTTPPATTGGSMQVFSQELCEMSYNAKELLSQLELGDGLQDIDYTYLPNRLLENINGSAGVQLSNGDLWSQSLVYFDDQNIKRTVWRDAIIANLRSYTYDYDFLKRLTVSSFNQTGETDAYNTTYTYKDHRGNLQALNRRSEGNIIDDLEYGYIDGTNQIESITDGAPSALKSQGFKSIGTTDYSYDDNGAMLYDQGRSIDFNYNHLNLPYKIEVPDSNGMIMYYYTGDGTLHRQEEIRDDIIYQIRDYIGGVEFVNGRLEQIKHDHGYVNLDQGLTEHHLQLTGTEPSNETYNTITTVSDRIVPDPIVTEYISEQMIILTPGFEVNFGADFHADIDVFPIQGLEYRYFIKDHLGSVRVEFEDDGTGTAVPTNVTNYYPFGLPWESDTDTRNNWTYTGQELQRSFDLGVMNYGARFYDPSIGRMMSVDPLADEISNLPWATYAYGWNNPINVIDPTGAFNEYVQITDSDGNVTTQKVSDAGGDQIDFVHHATDNGDGTLEIESTDVIEVVTAVSEGTEVHQRSPGFNILPGANPAAQATGSPVEAVPLLATNSARALVGGIMKGLVNLFKGKGGAKEGSSGGPGAGKRFSDKTKNLAEQEARSRCVFCNQKTVRKPGPNQRNTDHAIPKSRGGNNTLKNAQNTCRTCNLKKGTKTTREFLNQKVGQ